MKKGKILLFGLAVFVSACNKNSTTSPIDELTTIEVEKTKTETASYPEVPHDIPIPPGGIIMPLPKFPSATEAKKFFEENKTSPNFINTVKAKNIALKIVAPPGSNFDCMDYVNVYMSTNVGDEILVGKKTNIPKGSTVIQADAENVELKNYFIQDTIYFRVEPHIIDYPPSNGVIEVGATFKVSITASKI